MTKSHSVLINLMRHVHEFLSEFISSALDSALAERNTSRAPILMAGIDSLLVDETKMSEGSLYYFGTLS